MRDNSVMKHHKRSGLLPDHPADPRHRVFVPFGPMPQKPRHQKPDRRTDQKPPAQAEDAHHKITAVDHTKWQRHPAEKKRDPRRKQHRQRIKKMVHPVLPDLPVFKILPENHPREQNHVARKYREHRRQDNSRDPEEFAQNDIQNNVGHRLTEHDVPALPPEPRALLIDPADVPTEKYVKIRTDRKDHRKPEHHIFPRPGLHERLEKTQHTYHRPSAEIHKDKVKLTHIRIVLFGRFKNDTVADPGHERPAEHAAERHDRREHEIVVIVHTRHGKSDERRDAHIIDTVSGNTRDLVDQNAAHPFLQIFLFLLGKHSPAAYVRVLFPNDISQKQVMHHGRKR